MLDRLRASCQQELASPHSILIASKNSEKKKFVTPTFLTPLHIFDLGCIFFQSDDDQVIFQQYR